MSKLFFVSCDQSTLEEKYDNVFKQPSLQITTASWESFIKKIESLTSTTMTETLNETLYNSQGKFKIKSVLSIKKLLESITFNENDSKFWIYTNFLELVNSAHDRNCCIVWG
jgi:hypothetical protein